MVTQFEILKKWTENKPHFGGDSFEKWIFTFHLLYSPHFKGKNQLLKSKVQKSQEGARSNGLLARPFSREDHMMRLIINFLKVSKTIGGPWIMRISFLKFYMYKCSLNVPKLQIWDLLENRYLTFEGNLTT